ncbi:MAG: hypothetical protein RTU92_07250 [Candidatus Thorarchaeota archaeon]
MRLEESDVIILEADGRIDATHGYGTPIHDALTEHEITSSIVPIAHNTEVLERLTRKPLILSGGMTEVTADIDWIRDLKYFILDIIKQNQQIEYKDRQPIMGICFGAQIIAECYSEGSVTYLDDPEIGVSRIRLAAKNHPLFSGFSNEFNAYSFHYNQIWSDRVRILSQHLHMGHRFIQAFEVPDASVFGVQFHPEFNHSQMITLYKTYRKLIKELGFNLQPIIDTLPLLSGNRLLLKNFYDSYC